MESDSYSSISRVSITFNSKSSVFSRQSGSSAAAGTICLRRNQTSGSLGNYKYNINFNINGLKILQLMLTDCTIMKHYSLLRKSGLELARS